jgi:hypothetical protein
LQKKDFLGLVLPIKTPQKFKILAKFTDLSNSIPINNSEEKIAEISAIRQHKKNLSEKFLIFRTNMWMLYFQNLSENFSELRFFLDRTKP